MPAPQCNADTVGQRYKCFICQHHQRYNGRGSFIDRYSWADYNTVHPCKRCTTSIFGSTTIEDKYRGCTTCEEQVVDINGRRVAIIEKRKPSSIGLSDKCFVCEENQIGIISGVGWAMMPKCGPYKCNETDGACEVPGSFCPGLDPNACQWCVAIVHGGTYGIFLWDYVIENSCYERRLPNGDIASVSNYYCDNVKSFLNPNPTYKCQCSLGDTGLFGGGASNLCEDTPKPKLVGKGFNIYTEQLDYGCWCECAGDVSMYYNKDPCEVHRRDNPDIEFTYDPEKCACVYSTNTLSQFLLP